MNLYQLCSIHFNSWPHFVHNSGTCEAGVWLDFRRTWWGLNRVIEMSSSVFLCPWKLAHSLTAAEIYLGVFVLLKKLGLLRRLIWAVLQPDRALATNENGECLRSVLSSSYRRYNPFHWRQTKRYVPKLSDPPLTLRVTSSISGLNFDGSLLPIFLISSQFIQLVLVSSEKMTMFHSSTIQFFHEPMPKLGELSDELLAVLDFSSFFIALRPWSFSALAGSYLKKIRFFLDW